MKHNNLCVCGNLLCWSKKWCALTADALVNKDEMFREGGPFTPQNSSKNSGGKCVAVSVVSATATFLLDAILSCIYSCPQPRNSTLHCLDTFMSLLYFWNTVEDFLYISIWNYQNASKKIHTEIRWTWSLNISMNFYTARIAIPNGNCGDSHLGFILCTMGYICMHLSINKVKNLWQA